MPIYMSYADMGEVPPDRTWSALRALRANPPASAGKADRRRVFSAALEQAEQLFRAAETVGVATKPLLLFYGLSQAGRAIAAAQAERDWVLSGHGIRIGRPEGRPRGIADLTVAPGTGGAFDRVRAVLNSSTLEPVARLGDLWPLLAETTRHALTELGHSRPLSVSVDSTGWPTGIPILTVAELPGSFADVGQEHLDLMTGLGANYAAQARALDEFLAQYPTLALRVPLTAAGQPIGLQPAGDGTCSVNFRIPDEYVQSHIGASSIERSIGVMTRGVWRVYPSLDGSDHPIHPLIVWWAILFRLSMLARYEPEAWDTMTDVNRSADAVPIEHLLGCALSSVPELIFNALSP